MSYRCDYVLIVEGRLLPYDGDALWKSLNGITGHKWERYDDKNFGLYVVGWSEEKADLQRLTKAWPDLKLSLRVRTEYEERWIIDAFNGKIHLRNSQRVFDARTLW